MAKTETAVSELKINRLTRNQYDTALENNNISETELYFITDEGYYTNTEIDTKFAEYLKLSGGSLTGALSIITNGKTAVYKGDSIEIDGAVISISDGSIKVGNNVLAKVSDIPSLTGYATEAYVNSKLSSVYRLKDSVESFSKLPSTGNTIGDVRNVTDTGMNYVWTGSEWDALGATVDHSNLATKTELSDLQDKIENGTDDFKAMYAEYATSADKTTQDGDGNVISSTYIKTTGIKTINGESLLGTGDITITGGGDASIDDTKLSTSTTYSSSKIHKTYLPITSPSVANLLTTPKVRSADGSNLTIKAGDGDESHPDGYDLLLSGGDEDGGNPGSVVIDDNSDLIPSNNNIQNLGSAAVKWKSIYTNSINGTLVSTFATQSWVTGKGYLTEHQSLKTINGESLVGTGNITVSAESGASIDDSTTSTTKTWSSSKISEEIPDIVYSETTPENPTEGMIWLKTADSSSGGGSIDVDENPTEGSKNAVSSGGVYSAIATIKIPTKTSELTNDSGFITEHQSLSAYATIEYVDNKVSSVYRYRNSVASYDNLPSTGNVVGDVYNVEDTGMNYAWNGLAWDALGSSVDLTNYATKNDVQTNIEAAIGTLNTALENRLGGK